MDKEQPKYNPLCLVPLKTDSLKKIWCVKEESESLETTPFLFLSRGTKVLNVVSLQNQEVLFAFGTDSHRFSLETGVERLPND